MTRKLSVITLLVLLGTVFYFSLVVYQANQYTKDVVLKDYGNNEWRIHKQSAKSLSIKLANLTPEQIKWLVLIQDPGFYAHNGFDLSTSGAGLTTITQSITKKLYFENFKPGFRKLKQTLIATFVVDNLIDKNKQLEIFINSAYMGRKDDIKVYGFYQAAKTYYNKSFSALTSNEYLSLVAMLIAPKTFNIYSNHEENINRVSRIKKVISGEYVPQGLMDVYYNQI